MTLMQTWRDSLLVFLPQQFKLFFMVTVKTIIETYFILFTRLWWVVLFDVAFFLSMSFLERFLQANFLVNPLYFLVYNNFISFLVFLAMRPSVLKKDNLYFFRYWFYFILFFSFIAVLFFVIAALFLFKLSFLRPLLMLDNPLIVSPLVIFFALFLLDSDGTIGQAIKSVGRSIKMVWYNYPFCLISYIFFCYAFLPIVIWLIEYFSAISIAIFPSVYTQFIIAFVARYFYFWLCMPLVLSFVVNFYVKVIYQQLSFYFPAITKDD